MNPKIPITNALFIAPHADDEIISCGGTIAKLIHSSVNVSVAVMTNAHFGCPEEFSEKTITQIREEAVNSYNFLGLKNYRFYDFPAPALDQFPSFKISSDLSPCLPHHNFLYLPEFAQFSLQSYVLFI